MAFISVFKKAQECNQCIFVYFFLKGWLKCGTKQKTKKRKESFKYLNEFHTCSKENWLVQHHDCAPFRAGSAGLEIFQFFVFSIIIVIIVIIIICIFNFENWLSDKAEMMRWLTCLVIIHIL